MVVGRRNHVTFCKCQNRLTKECCTSEYQDRCPSIVPLYTEIQSMCALPRSHLTKLPIFVVLLSFIQQLTKNVFNAMAQKLSLPTDNSEQITIQSSLMYASKRVWFLLRCGVVLIVILLCVLCTTSLGYPYKWDRTASPRLRRCIIEVFFVRLLQYGFFICVPFTYSCLEYGRLHTKMKDLRIDFLKVIKPWRIKPLRGRVSSYRE